MNDTQFHNQNTAFRFHGVDVSVNLYGGDSNSEYNVNATYRKDERTESVSLRYSHNGVRLTEVSDFSNPFNTAFYALVDSYLSALANANNLIVAEENED